MTHPVKTPNYVHNLLTWFENNVEDMMIMMIMMMMMMMVVMVMVMMMTKCPEVCSNQLYCKKIGRGNMFKGSSQACVDNFPKEHSNIKNELRNS